MKKRMLLSAFLLILFLNYSEAQIEQQLRNSDKLTLVKLTDFDMSDYTYHKYASEIRPNLMVNPFGNNIARSNQIWVGSKRSYRTDICNLRITSNHSYDINSNLRQSSWSLRLNSMSRLPNLTFLNNLIQP